jgi:hypothetical protein
MPLTIGPKGWPAGQLLCQFRPKHHGHVSTREGEGQNIMDTCLHETVKKVGGGQTHWLAGHVAWPPGHRLVSYHLDQVGGAPPRPYKYPPTGGNQNTHHILEIPHANLSFLL